MRSVIIIIWVCLALKPISAITAYDCGGNILKVKTLSAVEVSSCTMAEKDIKTKNVQIQLIQPTDFEEIKFSRCSIIALHHVFRCGKSIDTNHDAGFYSETISTTKSECEDIIKYKKYRYPITTGLAEFELRLNHEHSFSVTSVGSISEGSCTPVEELTVNGRTYKRAVRLTILKVTVSEEEGRLDVEEGTLSIPNGNKFRFFDGEGFSADFGYIFWDINFKAYACMSESKNYQVLYQGVASKVSEASPEISTVSYVFTMNSEYTTQMYIKQNVVSSVCGLRVYQTEHPKLFIIEKIEGVEFNLKYQKINSLDVNLATYFNSKLQHVMRHTKSEVERLYKLMIYERCKTESRVTRNLLTQAAQNPIEFAYSYMQGPGYTAVMLGEVVYISQCSPVEVMLAPSNGKCYNELRVMKNNKTMFLQPKTKILVQMGSEIDCTSALSPMYKINGQWFVSGVGGLYSTHNPELIIPDSVNYTFNLIQSLAEGGIYSQETLDKMQGLLLSPMTTSTITTQVVRALEGKTSLPTGYLIKNTFSTEDFKFIEDNLSTWFSRWYNNIKDFGSVCAFCLSLFIVLRFVKSIFNTFINGFVLKREFGWSWILLFSCWENMVHLCISWKLKKAMRESSDHTSSVGKTTLRAEQHNKEEIILMEQPILSSSEGVSSSGFYPRLSTIRSSAST